MKILLQFIIAYACNIYHEEYNIYPTEDETIEIQMESLFKDLNLKFDCKDCGDNIKINKTMDLIYRFEINYTLTSVSFFENHFAALTSKHTINIYEKIDKNIVLKNITNIEQGLNCINIIFFNQSKVLMDCYTGSQLFLYYVENDTMIQSYQTKSSLPLQTKLSYFINSTSSFILYGQFYNGSGIITLFNWQSQNQLKNLTIQKGQIFDFVVSSSRQTNNYILVQYPEKVIPYQISSTFQFSHMFTVPITGYTTIKMALYPYINYNSQCDLVIIIVLSFNQFYTYNILWICQHTYEIFPLIPLKFNIVQLQSLMVNNNFIIMQDNNTIGIFKMDQYRKVLLQIHQIIGINWKNSLLYFDQITEQLYIFHHLMEVNQLSIPAVTFTSNNTSGRFIITTQDKFTQSRCQVSVFFQQISQLDSNIYPIYQGNQIQYYHLLQHPFLYPITRVSGPLIQSHQNLSNNSIGKFQDSTLSQLEFEFNNDYQIIKVFSMDIIYKCRTNLIGCICMFALQNQTLDVYLLARKIQQITLPIENTTNLVNQIEISYFVTNRSFCYVVGLNINPTAILIFIIQPLESQLKVEQNFTLNVQIYKQFQFISNAVILLLQSNQIGLYTFDNTEKILLNTEILTNLLNKNVSLTPINIFVNQQMQSRILYINNNNSFLISFISETLNFTISDIKFVPFAIKYLTVIKTKVILTYQCQNGLSLCIQVWNTKNLYDSKFEKQLLSVEYTEDLQIYSDDQFLYINNGTTMHVYNPNLPQHQSLYKLFNFSGTYFSSVAFKDQAILSYNYSLYLLSSFQIQQFKISQIINNQFFTQEIFNFTFSSQLNKTQNFQSQNNSLTIVNNYITINFNQNYFPIYSKQSQNITLRRENISVNGQILSFSISNNYSNELFNNLILTNNFEYQNTSQNSGYTLITKNNNQFILMNNKYIQFYNQNISFQFGDFTDCLATTASNNVIYAFCQNQTAYIYSLQINNETIQSPHLIANSNPSFNNLVWLKIYDGLLYLYLNQYISMYVLNQQGQQQPNPIGDGYYFSFQAITLKNKNNYKVIAYFYFRLHTQFLLTYRIATLINNQYNSSSELYIVLEQIKYLEYIEFDTILVINFTQKQIVLMISNQSYNFIISILWIQDLDDVLKSRMILQDILQASPPYSTHEFNITEFPQYQNGLLLFVYSNTQNSTNQTYLFTLYNNSQIQNVDKSSPLFYVGGYIFTLNTTQVCSMQFIALNQSYGEIVILFNNNSMTQININEFSIQMQLQPNPKRQSIIFELTAYNYYNSTSANITFEYRNKSQFITDNLYVMIALLLLVIIAAIIVYYKGTKNMEDQKDQQNELDDYSEMEL